MSFPGAKQSHDREVLDQDKETEGQETGEERHEIMETGDEVQEMRKKEGGHPSKLTKERKK